MKRSKQRRDMKKITIILIIAMVCLGFSFSYCHAEEFRMVWGVIESVSDDTIEVNGTHYKLLGVPIKNSAEKRVSKDQLKIGRFIEIFFKGNKIDAMIIYDENMGG